MISWVAEEIFLATLKTKSLKDLLLPDLIPSDIRQQAC